MNKSTVMKLATCFNEESKIILSNGTIIEGAEKVAEFTLLMCGAYTKGFIQGSGRILLKGIVGGVCVYGGYKVYRAIDDKRKFKLVKNYGEGAK